MTHALRRSGTLQILEHESGQKMRRILTITKRCAGIGWSLEMAGLWEAVEEGLVGDIKVIVPMDRWLRGDTEGYVHDRVLSRTVRVRMKTSLWSRRVPWSRTTKYGSSAYFTDISLPQISHCCGARLSSRFTLVWQISASRPIHNNAWLNTRILHTIRTCKHIVSIWKTVRFR